MTAVQLDLLTTQTGTIDRRLPDGAHVIESPAGAWRAALTRWGWCMYRLTRFGQWETWEPDLPHGQMYVTERGQAEQLVAAEAARLGDWPLYLR